MKVKGKLIWDSMILPCSKDVIKEGYVDFEAYPPDKSFILLVRMGRLVRLVPGAGQRRRGQLQFWCWKVGKGSTKLQNNSISKALRDCVNLEEKLTVVLVPRVEVD